MTTGKVWQSFMGNVIKGGYTPEKKLAMANARLKLKYQVDNPIQLAIEAVKPILQHPRKNAARGGGALKGSTMPTVLTVTRQYNLAVKWLLEAARNRKYINNCHDFEKGLFDEVSAILDGTSSIYNKRYLFHRGS